MFALIVQHHLTAVRRRYVDGFISKSEFQCGMAYLWLLKKRLVNHYERMRKDV